MQQVVEADTRCREPRGLVFPVAPEPGLAPGEQVVAPAVLGVAPVIGLVDQLLAGGGGLSVLDQPHFHFIDPSRQRPGIEGLQPGGHCLGIDQ
ncbi:hypothetical protein FQZ97_1098280 [compost metagenome]